MAITFENDNHKAAYEKVAGMLRDEFGRQASAMEDRAAFLLRRGSAVTQVYVDSISEKNTCVRAFSWVVTGPEQSSALFTYLLKANMGMRYGAFAIDDVGDILFTHAILGESVTHDTLMWTVYGVANVADDHDDEIVKRFGGHRAVDRS